MMSNTTWNEERIAGLLSRFRPAPQGWVEAAAELPRLRSVLDDLVARAESDAAVRAQLIADLETALESAGVEPTPRTVAELRARLQS
jgi:hypothetical protein